MYLGLYFRLVSSGLGCYLLCLFQIEKNHVNYTIHGSSELRH